MPKNIVFCADGTWNGPGVTDADNPNDPWTNVFKLFLNLAGADDPGTTQLGKEQERSLTAANGTVEQIAKYLHGVGDSANELSRLIGGGLGVGLITRIVRGYTFISRNYQAGDKIYITGFSRGAYTARALAGLISAMGLLAPDIATADDKTGAYRSGTAVWVAWRRKVLRTKGSTFDNFEAFALDLPGFVQQPPDPSTMVAAPIEAVAVWDTVGALGIPIFTAQHVALDVFQFADKTLSPNVHYARHAIAIDELREDFAPTLWNADPRITQVLFPGAHADVGGGYPTQNDESGLSDGALLWMTAELSGLGVKFLATPTIAPNPDAAGKAHWPWSSLLWQLLPRAPRSFPDGLGLSRSVIARMNAGQVFPDPNQPTVLYRPTNIPGYLNGTAAASGINLA